MLYQEKISWIKGTPLGIRIRNVKFVPTHMHENIVEIFFCMKGSVRFSYGFEEFTLSAGEFISVDKDAHFIYAEQEENICVSFYIDLSKFLDKYPFVTSLLFVCEATKESDRPYPTYHHNQMKGILIAILFYLSNRRDDDLLMQGVVRKGAGQIVDQLVDHFDITYYYHPELTAKKEMMERSRSMQIYLNTHASEKITLATMAADFGLTTSYVSEFMRLFEVGFRKSLSYIRANNSERLLLNTDLTIMDISEACGFSDPKYYYSAFKEWYKCTPRQFRQIYRNRMDMEGEETELGLVDVLGPLDEMMRSHYLELFLF